jgi:hypothetical protein
MQSLVSPSIQIIYAFAMRTCRICKSWLLFHLIFTIYLRALPLGLSVSVISSPPSSPMHVSRVCESPDLSRLVSNCIDIGVRLSCRCCHHPCFTNPFTPSSLPLPVSHLPHTRVSSSLCFRFRCAFCFVCYRYSSLIPREPFGRILYFPFLVSFTLLIIFRTIPPPH